MVTTNNSTDNAFIRLQEQANGRVSVKLQKNTFDRSGRESFFGKVERYTYNSQNILDVMAESLPNVDLGTVTSVLNAYANTVLKVLSSGSAVKFGQLGTFYIAGKGLVENATGKPSLTVKFSATPVLKSAVQNIEITSSEYTENSGSISHITDIATGRSDGLLSRKGSVLLEGSCIKLGGEGSGIWFAPLSENESPSKDESLWVKVSSTMIYNTPSKLLFALPENLEAGKYRIVHRSRLSTKSGYERKVLSTTISEPVEIA